MMRIKPLMALKLYWTPVKTSAKNPDQIWGRHQSKYCTIEASVICMSVCHSSKHHDFHITVKSTKYKSRKVNMCARTLTRRGGGVGTKFINSYEGDTSKK